MTASGEGDQALADRLVMDHARPVVVALLRDLGLREQAAELAGAPSLGALRFAAARASHAVRRRVRFSPLRRATAGAVSALHSAALLGLHSDPDSVAVMALGTFAHAAHAQAWRRRWWQLLRWKTVRAQVLAQARAKQLALFGDTSGAQIDKNF